MMSKKNIRNEFRSAVFKRDNFTCKVCDSKKKEEELDAHHITDRHLLPNGGYVAANGITVCKVDCHYAVELFHIYEGERWNEGLHPNNLYKKINSSYEQALKDSEKLKL